MQEAFWDSEVRKSALFKNKNILWHVLFKEFPRYFRLTCCCFDIYIAFLLLAWYIHMHDKVEMKDIYFYFFFLFNETKCFHTFLGKFWQNCHGLEESFILSSQHFPMFFWSTFSPVLTKYTWERQRQQYGKQRLWYFREQLLDIYIRFLADYYNIFDEWDLDLTPHGGTDAPPRVCEDTVPRRKSRWCLPCPCPLCITQRDDIFALHLGSTETWWREIPCVLTEWTHLLLLHS